MCSDQIRNICILSPIIFLQRRPNLTLQRPLPGSCQVCTVTHTHDPRVCFLLRR